MSHFSRMDHVDKIRAQWKKERPGLQTQPMVTIGRMKRLSQYLGDGMERVFSAYGLNRAGFDVLATLRRSGPPYALTPSALMDWTMVTSGTMTNRLDRLEAAGLIRRDKDPNDGRSVVVALTETGFRLIDEAVGAHVENQKKLISALSDEDRETLDRLLAKWLAGFEKPEGETGR